MSATLIRPAVGRLKAGFAPSPPHHHTIAKVGLLLGAAVTALVARRSGSLLVAVGAGLAVVAATSYAAGLM
jgi:hypothetical protein